MGIISARDVGLCAESRFQPNRRKSIARFGRNRPCSDVSGTERAELPDAFVIKIQSGRLRCNGARSPRTQGVAHLLSRASFESRLPAVQTQVIDLQGHFAGRWPSGVHAPEANGVIRSVVKEPEVVQVGTYSESVDLPRVNLAFDHEAVKAQPNIRTFPHINQAPGAILEFLPANTERDGVRTFGSAKFEKSGLEVELLFVDGPRTTYA